MTMRPGKSVIMRKPTSQGAVNRLAARLKRTEEMLASKKFRSSLKAKNGVRIRI
jgi:hypothetical protein